MATFILGLRIHLFDHKPRVHDRHTRTKSYKDAGVLDSFKFNPLTAGAAYIRVFIFC